jgi:hypothetical protein
VAITSAPGGSGAAATSGEPAGWEPCGPCAATPALTGFSGHQFHELVARSEPEWRRRRLQALDRPGRLTRVGGGRKFSLPFAGRLFLAVLHQRWGVTYRALAAMFGVGTQTVERACRDLRPMLAAVPVHSVSAPYHRSSQLLLAELERTGVTERRALLEALGAGPCHACAAGPGNGATANGSMA